MKICELIAFIHEDYAAFVDLATDVELAKFIRAQICESKGAPVPELDGLAKALFDTHSHMMDEDEF